MDCSSAASARRRCAAALAERLAQMADGAAATGPQLRRAEGQEHDRAIRGIGGSASARSRYAAAASGAAATRHHRRRFAQVGHQPCVGRSLAAHQVWGKHVADGRPRAPATAPPRDGAAPAPGRELGVHRAAHDGVSESQWPAGGQDSRLRQRVGRARRFVQLQTRERRGMAKLGFGTQDGDGERELDGVRAQVTQTHERRAGDRRRREGGDPLGVGQPAGCPQLPDELSQQERIATRGVVAGALHRGVAWPIEQRAHQGGRGLRAHGPQLEADGYQRGLGLRREVLAGALAGAGGVDQDQRQAVRAPGEVIDEAQRLPVGPVRVVDEQNQGLLGG